MFHNPITVLPPVLPSIRPSVRPSARRDCLQSLCVRPSVRPPPCTHKSSAVSGSGRANTVVDRLSDAEFFPLPTATFTSEGRGREGDGGRRRGEVVGWGGGGWWRPSDKDGGGAGILLAAAFPRLLNPEEKKSKGFSCNTNPRCLENTKV